MHIVVLEQPASHLSLARRLVGAGYSCDVADTDRSCMIKCLAHRPDTVVVDLDTPGSRGVAFLRGLAQRFPLARMVVTSASDDEGVIADVFKAGSTAYLLKPVSELTLDAVFHRFRQ